MSVVQETWIVSASDAADAIEQAWVRARIAGWTVRTVASCRPVPDQPGIWAVKLAVERKLPA